MEVTDLPTLFQVAVAQEANAQSIESLHALFLKQQEMIEQLRKQNNSMKNLIDAQQSLIENMYNETIKK
jgi:hypothetical protein|tara:strand:- start:652 stop:858 length:207 start_codon:yes stop_codon:yes gene_type:complete